MRMQDGVRRIPVMDEMQLRATTFLPFMISVRKRFSKLIAPGKFSAKAAGGMSCATRQAERFGVAARK
jgi:hypothetical protein